MLAVLSSHRPLDPPSLSLGSQDLLARLWVCYTPVPLFAVRAPAATALSRGLITPLLVLPYILMEEKLRGVTWLFTTSLTETAVGAGPVAQPGLLGHRAWAARPWQPADPLLPAAGPH